MGYIDCFSTHGYHEAGIRHARGFFPAAPDRAGFATLFENSEADGLRLFHRLEMRASVYLRHYHRRHKRRPLRPVLVPTPWGEIPSWGNKFEYQWSRGVLGSDCLGSCYLALDDWIWTQLNANRPMAELCRLVLQRNGLAATASLLICAIASKAEEPDVPDAAAPFLATPRLWDYDVQRFTSLQGYAHPIGFMHLGRHFHEADQSCQRWRRRTFLSQDLLLRFHLMAGNDAKSLLDSARQNWAVAHLATHDDELKDSERIRELEDRLVRIRSDADPASVSGEPAPEHGGLKVWIEPPAEHVDQVILAQEEQRKNYRIMGLMNWVMGTEKAGAIESAMTIYQAIEHAKELQQLPQTNEQTEAARYHRRIAGTAIVGTAWAVARFGPDGLLEGAHEWIVESVLAGCRTLEFFERDKMLVDDAVLFMGPAALWCKRRGRAHCARLRQTRCARLGAFHRRWPADRAEY